MYVTGKSSGVLAPGQQLSIWGGFFTDSCQVLFDGVAVDVQEVTDGEIIAVCPDTVGTYEVSVKQGSTAISAGSIGVAVLEDTPLVGRPKDYSLEHFVSYVRGLFPRGAVLDLAPSSNFGKFIKGLALAVQYLWAKIADMYRGLDAAHTSNFDEWEADMGLPVDGVIVNDFDDRRSEIYRVACTKGGATIPYFKKILRLMGYEADIYEYYKYPAIFEDYTFPENADKFFYFCIQLYLTDVNVNYADCETGSCDSYLVTWEDSAVESVINAVKPSHTAVVFSYDSDTMFYLMDRSGNYLTDKEGLILLCSN